MRTIPNIDMHLEPLEAGIDNSITALLHGHQHSEIECHLLVLVAKFGQTVQ